MTSGEEELVQRAVVRLRARILALVFGLTGGTGILLATAGLLIQDGENVGQHLQLLSNYCPGYSVTWLGAVVGFVYGAVYGGLVGYAVAWLYNRVADQRAA